MFPAVLMIYTHTQSQAAECTIGCQPSPAPAEGLAAPSRQLDMTANSHILYMELCKHLSHIPFSSVAYHIRLPPAWNPRRVRGVMLPAGIRCPEKSQQRGDVGGVTAAGSC